MLNKTKSVSLVRIVSSVRLGVFVSSMYVNVGAFVLSDIIQIKYVVIHSGSKHALYLMRKTSQTCSQCTKVESQRNIVDSGW